MDHNKNERLMEENLTLHLPHQGTGDIDFSGQVEVVEISPLGVKIQTQMDTGQIYLDYFGWDQVEVSMRIEEIEDE